MSNLACWETAEASEMTPIKSSSPPVVTDSLCNVEPEISQVKKRKKKRQKATQDAKSGSCGDVSSLANSSLPGGLCLESEVYIGNKSDLKSGLPRDLCLESEVDMSTDAGSKTAEASEMTHIEKSSLPVVTDSICNVEQDSSQAKKRNKKRQKATQDSQSDPPEEISSIKSSSLRRDLCLESELHISTKLDLKSGQTSEMTPINDTSGPVVTNSSQTEKKKKKRQKRVQDDGKSDPPGEVSSLENSSLQRDSCSESAVDVSAKVDSETAQASGTNTISTSPPPVVTDHICNVEFESSETKNREKKTRTKKKKKQKQQGLQDLQLETPGDVSSIKDSSLQRDSPVETAVYTSTKVDLKTSQASETTLINDSSRPAVPDALCNVESRSSQPKKKKKERQKRMQDAQSDPSRDVPSMKNSFLERDLCFESEVSTMKGLEIAQASGMTAINNSSQQVVTDSDNVKPESSQADKGNKGEERVQDALEDFSDNMSIKSSSLERNFCLEPEVDFSSKGDFERVQPSMTPISNSSQLVLMEPLDDSLRAMKTRKKKKIMQDVQADLPGDISSIKNSSIGGDSSCEPEADICTKADLKTAQSSQISSTELDRKRKRRKQGKLKAVTVDVCVPLEVASTSLLEGNAFRAEQQSGFPGNASASLTRYDKELVPLEASSTRLMGQNTLSGISSLMKISDSMSQHDIVSQENEIVQAFQKDDGSLKPYHRKRKSHDALGNSAQPIVQTCDGSENILDVQQVEVHISSIKDVQDNLDEKGSSLSNGKVGFEENGKMTVMKINVDNDGLIMEENTPQVPHWQKVMQDAKSGSCRNVSSIKNSSLPGGLCLECEVYIGTKSDLKSGLPRDSCLESEVDMSTDAGSKTAKASEMTPIKSSSPPVVTDSLCNVEPEIAQVKKRKKKRQKATQDAKSGSCGDVSSLANSSLPGSLCLESEVYIGTKSDLKSGQTSEMTPINDTSGPVVISSSQTEKKKKKRQKRVQDDGKSDPPGEVSSLENSSLQRDSCSESAVDVSAKVDSETAQASGTNAISTSPPPVVTDYICNVEFESSETKNREKKTRTKKRKKQKQQGLQDLQLETPGDVSSIKDSSLQRDSPVETAVYSSTKVDLKTSQATETTLVNDSSLPAVPDALCNVESRSSQPKKKKKERQKRMQDAQSDPSRDVPSTKNSFLERDLCFEFEVSTMKDLEIAQALLGLGVGI